jgi:AraC-like DNA-binding protein
MTTEDISTIKNHLGEFQKRNFFSGLGAGRFLLISGLESPKNQARPRQESLMKQFAALNRQLAGGRLSLSASISRAYPLSGLGDAYTGALALLGRRSVLGRGTVLCADFLPEERTGDNPENLGKYSDAVLKAVINQNERELRNALDTLREGLLFEENIISRVKEEILHTAERINHYLLDRSLDKNCFDIMALQRDMGGFVFLEDLIPWWEESLQKIIHRVKKINDHAKSPRMAQAIDYIEAHLFEDISAELVAGILNSTPNYFSAQFKKETGQSFKAYINRERLDAAAYLLSHTDDPVYTVAEKTGYHDYNYFSQVFKQAFGSSPGVYRSQCRVAKKTDL